MNQIPVHSTKKQSEFNLLIIFLWAFAFLSSSNGRAQCAGEDIVTNSSGSCLPALVRFIATPAQASGSVYYWDLGDGKGQIAGGDTFYHQYTKGGSYGAALEILLPSGTRCKVNKPSGFLFFDGATSLGFYADQTLLCNLPAVISLHDTTGNIKSRDWYINGNLYADHGKDITDTITTSGYVSVTLAITNNGGCIEVVDKKNYINIGANIPVGFCSILKENKTHDQITASFKIGFDTTGYHLTEIDWDFPGGSPSSYSGYKPPNVTYTDLSSPHTVSLTVKTKTCLSIATKTNLIDKYYSTSKSTFCQRDISNLDYIANSANGTRDQSFLNRISSNIRFYFFDNIGKGTISFKSSGIADLKFAIFYRNSSCMDTLIVPALFNILPPSADFTSVDRNQCKTPAKVHFHALFGNPASGTNTYFWQIYDSLGTEISGSPLGPLKGTDTSFTFNNLGSYTVKLITQNSGGCSDTALKPHFVRIIQPDVDFTVSPDTFCTGDTLTTKNLSKVIDDPLNPLIFDWRFTHHDSSKYNIVAAGRAPKIIFQYPGVYTVSLTIYNGSICSATKTLNKFIYVNGVNADIKVTGINGCAPITKNLSALVFVNNPAGPLSYLWTVKPAADATIQNPTAASTDVQFNRQGCYSISLAISTSFGCKSVVKKDSFICIGTKAAFTYPVHGCRNTVLALKNTSRQDPDQFKWTVTPSIGVTIDSDTARNPKIKIKNPGCYSVTLRTSKSSLANCFDTVSHLVCIFNSPQVLKFYSPDSSSHCAPRFDKFYAKANFAKKYFWDFGDTSKLITNDTVAAHAYFKNNNLGYTVKVAAIDSNGCTSDTVTLKNYIKIAGPEPNIVITSKPPCDGGTITFLNNSKYVYNYFFTYGDNSGIDSNRIRSHFYKFIDYTKDSNTYLPTMFAFDETGCVATSAAIVKLYRPPVVKVSASDTIGCSPLSVTFLDSTKYASNYIWIFGDGGNDTVYMPTHVYTKASPVGNPFKAVLTAITNKGCTKTSPPISVTVHPTPHVRILINAPKIICYQDSVHFTGITGGVAVQQYKWNFGDSINIADTSSLPNPVYHYKYPGRHSVSFLATTDFGCADKITDTSIVTLDSIAPAPPNIRFVTVTNTNQVEIVYEKKSAPKFASNTVYSYPSGTPVYSTTDIADTVVLDYTPQVDVNKRSYGYAIRTTDICGFLSAYSKPHHTIFLTVSKAGNKVLRLNWNKYTGWDSVRKYEIYRLASKNKYALLGTVSGLDSTFTDSNLCTGPYTYYVNAIYRNRVYVSTSNIVTNSPDYIYPTTPLVFRKATVINNQQISVNWDSTTESSAKSYTLERNANGEGWQSPYTTTKALSFVDYNVDVNRFSYQYRVKVEDQCGNTGPVSNIGTSILLNGLVTNDIRFLEWNPYQLWAQGVSAYYMQLQQKNGTFKDISVVSAFDTIFGDSSAHADLGVPTCYRLYAVENTEVPSKRDTSYSNIACPNLGARLYIPNGFSPNGDSINEVFKPIGLSILNNSDSKDLQYDFRIYNRWGQLIFESHDFNKGWDGTYRGEFVPVDVYVYIVEAHGLDARRFFIRGQVTLFK